MVIKVKVHKKDETNFNTGVLFEVAFRSYDFFEILEPSLNI